MRVSEYKIINEMCDSLTESIDYIRDSGDKSLLKTCIELLSAVLNCVEAEIDQNLWVKDAVLNIAEEIEEIIKGKEDMSTVSELISIFSSKCRNELKYKYRILFVAELGGKWDAMDSVYWEFAKRDDCQVDVVIEPVFRVVQYQDGSTKNDVTYYDYLTPMGIKHILYKDYDMEKIRPDITFFSQPYESCTIEMFWPENMSKYSKVVYLPYFSSRSLKKSISSTFDSYFLLKTQQYAWKIPCQSELMKRYFEMYASRKGENVIVTGIPKWDYPMKLNKKNTPCPQEWKNKIKNKKTFLWSTHFSNVSNGQTPFSDVMDVINIFKRNQNIALIWRPHPMTETVVKLYSPELYPTYKSIMNDVEKSKNIVIDQYKTYDRAFVWSDAYITTGSSLDDQYLLTGKPFGQIIYKTDEELSERFYNVDRLWDFSKITFLKSAEEIERFVLEISDGNDPTADNRKYLLDNYFELADGNVGKRLVQKLIDEYSAEIESELNKKNNNKTADVDIENKKILIIGSSKDSKPCVKSFEELREKYNIDYFVSNDYYEDQDYNTDVKFFSMYDLKKTSFDIIVITDKLNDTIIFDLLTNVYKISKDKIIRFWKMYTVSRPPLHCDRVMMVPNADSYEGIILGISHTEVEILEKKLKKNFVNLSLSSQDLFYQLKTLEYCMKKYPDKLSGLKYAIIDLYDYKYFSYDTSMSKSALKYLSYGGYNLDPHNFERNKNFDCTYDEAVEAFDSSRTKDLTYMESNAWNKLFKDVYKNADYVGCESNIIRPLRITSVTDEEVDLYINSNETIGKTFNKTIEDNVHCLELIFDNLLSINKDIKVYTIIIPKYIKTEIGIQENMLKFTERFNNIIEELHRKYEFTMLDFNKISDISTYKEYYFNAAHLNYIGASWLTNKLNEIIFDDQKPEE